MLFNSFEFLLGFLPVTFGVYLLLQRWGRTRAVTLWLVIASLFFYAWWRPVNLPLLLFSVAVNYFIGLALSRDHIGGLLTRRLALTLGIIINLGLLGYFKYANFALEVVSDVTGYAQATHTIILPLAISFFTFQQIAYLVDSYKGYTREYDFIQYTLFVVFFPQLIAGPIVHHGEIIPQLGRALARVRWSNIGLGCSIFLIGLFKKVVLADSAASYANPVFAAAELGMDISTVEAWCGALAYTFQLYFDFSGYSDMAIGLARLFGLVLPLNFFSPYKARNIIDFWRRWHMTLSRFLRDYLYIPLGGNRHGNVRRYANLLTTMLLGGLWHGAGWTFVIWGGLHGIYLIINHLWQAVAGRGRSPSLFGRLISTSLTFLAVVVAWVFFRAADLASANAMLRAMFVWDGLVLPDIFASPLQRLGLGSSELGVTFAYLPYFGGFSELGLLLVLACVVFLFPNTHQIMSRYRPSLGPVPDPRRSLLHFSWRPKPQYAVMVAGLMFASFLFIGILGNGEFIYFQF